MDKHFTLTSGHTVFASGSECDVLIGQNAGCDIRLENRTPYVDRTVAKISPDKSGEGWHIIRLCDADISVNGEALNRINYLNDGDVIDFGADDRYRFKIAEGHAAANTVTIVHRNSAYVWLLGILLVAMAGTAIWYASSGKRGQLSERQLTKATSSLLRTEVDSVCMWLGDSLIESYVPTSKAAGTAFVTTDSLIVTARHCVEPWLNAVQPEEISDIPDLDERLVQMALAAETANQLAGEEKMRLVSHLSVTDPRGRRAQMLSTDFAINRMRDEIVELGDYDTDLYWRSIAHRHGRSDMMLGDVAVAKADSAGHIALAKPDVLLSKLKPRTPLTFMGFPQSEQSGEEAEAETDMLRQPVSFVEGDGATVFMLAHGGRLAPGYSGGPVLIRDGSGFAAVGIISVLDAKNGHRSYSVPVTEVTTTLLKP